MVFLKPPVEMVNHLAHPYREKINDFPTSNLPDSLSSIGDLASMGTASDTHSHLNLHQLSKACCQSPLLQFMKTLQNTVAFYCQLTKEIIKTKEDCSFLHEYHKRWSAFVAFAIKQDEVMSSVAYSMNRVYEALFPGFPMIPTFSIFRMMVKIWRREVFSPLQEALGREVLNILTVFQDSCLEYGKQKRVTVKKSKQKLSNSSGFFSRMSPNASPMFNSIGAAPLPNLITLSQSSLPNLSGNST
jgi:hypothetical protein